MDQVLKSLRRVVKRGDFKLSSGKRSDFYIDIKHVYTDPKILRKLGQKIAKMIKERRVSKIAGLELGAIPLVVSSSIYSGKGFLMVRKSKKGHGTSKLIEGTFKPGQSCVIVDDVLTSGSSVIKTKHILEKNGLNPIHLVVVVDRCEGGRERLEKNGLTVKCLYDRFDLLK